MGKVAGKKSRDYRKLGRQVMGWFGVLAAAFTVFFGAGVYAEQAEKMEAAKEAIYAKATEPGAEASTVADLSAQYLTDLTPGGASLVILGMILLATLGRALTSFFPAGAKREMPTLVATAVLIVAWTCVNFNAKELFLSTPFLAATFSPILLLLGQLLQDEITRHAESLEGQREVDSAPR